MPSRQAPQDVSTAGEDRIVQVNLTETKTIEVFSKPGSSIPITSKYYKTVKEKNEQYEKACLRQRNQYPKMFREGAAQTFHNYNLSQSTQTETEYSSVGVGHDPNVSNRNDILAENIVEELTSAALMTEGCLLNVSEGVRQGEEVFGTHVVPKSASYSDIVIAKAKQRFFRSNSVVDKLSELERAIQQNIYSTQQIKYRCVKIVGEKGTCHKNPSVMLSSVDEGDRLELLFRFQCDSTSNMKVTCMCWNEYNHDLLVVGYGSKQNSFHREGYVVCWSLRNQQYPEKLFKVSSSVTAVAFSSKKPELLAIGLHDGRVLLFDIALQRNFSAPLLDSAFSPGRHMAAVSKLQWVVDTHLGVSEHLVSMSVDGRVMQWSSKKGLSATHVITLKRTNNNLYNKGKLPNSAPGLSMAFLKDGLSYLTGTDDGSLSHCSLSYHEHPMATVKAHTGPLTSINISPFLENIFMTSSADSSVKIYSVEPKLESIVEVLTIHPTNLIGAINDISWSPKQSTLFALVAQDDRIELWDVSKSLLDPLVTWSQKDSPKEYGDRQRERTTVKFSLCGNILAVGDDQGFVELYRLHLDTSRNPQQLEQVLNKLRKSQGTTRHHET